MATIRSELKTRASASDVWSAIRDIGALHTRLVPGFVTDTKLEPGARVVTFVNGTVLREPIVTLDDEARRLVWSAEGGRARIIAPVGGDGRKRVVSSCSRGRTRGRANINPAPPANLGVSLTWGK